MEKTKTNTYHFVVPGTKLSYTIKLTYDHGFLRSLEAVNHVYNGRQIDVVDLPNDLKSAYLANFESKVKSAKITF